MPYPSATTYPSASTFPGIQVDQPPADDTSRWLITPAQQWAPSTATRWPVTPAGRWG